VSPCAPVTTAGLYEEGFSKDEEGVQGRGSGLVLHSSPQSCQTLCPLCSMSSVTHRWNQKRVNTLYENTPTMCDACEPLLRAMYDGVKEDVEDGIEWLLRRRKEDPFGDTVFRTLYEVASGGKQAPTFNP